MDFNIMKDLVTISQYIGLRPEYIQGGGGNTSIKLEDGLMAIKASGYLLKDIKEDDGYAVLDYKSISNFVKNYKGIDIETDGNTMMKDTTPEIDGIKKLKPSVEAGFHSLLLKYVIHSHSAYANILCCAKEGKSIAKKIFSEKNIKFLWLPYMNPGFELSQFMYNEIEKFKANIGEFPKVIFMENHGLIISDDVEETSMNINEKVNEIIKEYFCLDAFPQIVLDKKKDSYISKTKYVLDYMKKEKIVDSYFGNTILYPDQIVYINNNFGSDKIILNSNEKSLIYNCNEKEAVGIEETLLAYLYVIDTINKNKLTLQVMGEEAKAFIKNWDAEKYRKDLLASK